MHPYQARQAERDRLRAATARLIAEFAELPAGAAIGCVTHVREELLRAGVRHGLTDAVEAMARHRLRELAPVHT